MELVTLAGSTVGAVALIIVFGIPPLVARATTPATAAEAVAGLVRSLALFATLYFLVPGLVKIYIDFGAKLPIVTAWIDWASATAETIWLPTFLLLFASETLAVLPALQQSGSTNTSPPAVDCHDDRMLCRGAVDRGWRSQCRCWSCSRRFEIVRVAVHTIKRRATRRARPGLMGLVSRESE